MIKHFIAGMNVILLTVMVYAGVNLFYTIAAGVLETGTPAAAPRPEAEAVTTSTGAKRLSDYAEIAARNIFKAEKETEAAAPQAIDLESLRRTDLALRLLGTISGLGKDSYAVIEQTRKRQQDLYQVGDSVEGAAIKLIFRKKVVLTINGNDEVLEIPEERMAGQRPGNIRRSRAGAPQQPLEADPSAQQVSLSRQDVQNAFNNVNDLMKSIRLRPHFSGGRPDGIRLDSVAPDSIFNEMGLQSRDIIVGVNGKQINSVDDAMKIYQNLSSASRVMLQVKRGEEIQKIQYTIQ